MKVVSNLLELFKSISLSTLLLILLVVSACTKIEKEKPFLLGTGFGINSATLIVDDLKSASAYYKDTLGFDVPDKTQNSAYAGSKVFYISFPDLSALEILSLDDSISDDVKPQFISTFLKNNEGVRMYSLSSSSADSSSAWLASKGFIMDSIKSYRSSSETPDGWSWDNGEPDERRVDFASINQSGNMPGFVEYLDYDYQGTMKQWKTYYSYGRRYDDQPNGVVGTAAIIVAVESLDEAKSEFQKMGFEEVASNTSGHEAKFKLIRNQEIHLIGPQENGDVADFLTERGNGVFALRFEVKNLEETHKYLKERLPEEAMILTDSLQRLIVLNDYAKGVQLEFVQEPEEQGAMALMLRPNDKLDTTAMLHASELYTKYCALCHGDDRQGYANDNAPSLRSHSLLATSQGTNFMRYTIQYGRANTAMAGYRDLQGGPLEYIEIELILKWLYETAGVEKAVELSRDPVKGDVALGEKLYNTTCATCHGKDGEGITAPALGNPMLLATATDHFLRYAIAEGRDGTPMIAFKDSLSAEEIDGLTAFLRSRAAGWDVPKKDTVSIPKPENYVLNPTSKAPNFTLKEGKYLSAEQLIKAMRDSSRLVLLDARSEVAWRQMHIPGAIPVPYYEEPENFVKDIPNDSTWVVAYCACPHAASERVMNTLRRNGFKNTAILDEGILIWAQMGFPVQNGN
ncbi:c-type cytochrome [Fulvivirga lutimaris]|uniref:c-type cytochrome n=1 Tax=Fulvivirga lutimaris TaxID=1819566 RepID=UPI0012BC4E88|nr:c-type cytochrome [Fulvivirga lutimaris]MTI39267.1 c-type cytochrome [Fulvivirga lutimaris]